MSKYDVDEKELKKALERIASENWEECTKALDKGWEPDFQKAIGEWNTSRLKFGISQEYVDRTLEERDDRHIVWSIELPLKEQARDFLAKLHDFIYKCPKCESTNINLYSIGSVVTTYRDGVSATFEVDDVHEPTEIECDDCKHKINRDDSGGDHLDDEAFRCYKEKGDQHK